MTLLSTVQNVCRKIGKTPPSVVVTSTDATILELFVMANESGDAFAREHDFPELYKQCSFSATSTVFQGQLINSSAIVADGDYLRMVPETFWNTSLNSKLVLSPPAEWSQLQAMASTPYPARWTIIQGGLYIGPVTGPTSPNSCSFYYYSNKWVRSASGTYQTAYQLDTDVAVVPEKLIYLDLVWRWKQAKGLQYGEDMKTAELAIDQYTGSVGGAKKLLLGGGSNMYNPIVGGPTIPEGNWG